MSLDEKAAKLFCETERKLRAIVAEAADQGDYDSVLKFTGIAKSVSAIGAQIKGHDMANKTEDAKLDSNSPPPVMPLTRKIRSSSKSSKASYPKFFRRQQDLVKVGWSKSGKKEYQQKAGHKVLMLVAREMLQKATSQSIVSTDDILPLIDPDDGSEIPAYQPYICIAWMREARLIVQDGRQGYTVPSVNSLIDDVAGKWDSLERR